MWDCLCAQENNCCQVAAAALQWEQLCDERLTNSECPWDVCEGNNGLIWYFLRLWEQQAGAFVPGSAEATNFSLLCGSCESPGSYQHLTPHRDLLPDRDAQLQEAASQLCFLHLVLLWQEGWAVQMVNSFSKLNENFNFNLACLGTSHSFPVYRDSGRVLIREGNRLVTPQWGEVTVPGSAVAQQQGSSLLESAQVTEPHNLTPNQLVLLQCSQTATSPVPVKSDHLALQVSFSTC